jgi:hypothetical protein
MLAVTLSRVGTTGGGGIELIVVVDPDMVTQLGCKVSDI